MGCSKIPVHNVTSRQANCVAIKWMEQTGRIDVADVLPIRYWSHFCTTSPLPTGQNDVLHHTWNILCPITEIRFRQHKHGPNTSCAEISGKDSAGILM